MHWRLSLLGAGLLLAGWLWPHQVSAAGDCTVSPAQLTPDATEAQALSLINDYRSNHGAPRMVVSQPLERASAWMAHDMVRSGVLAHNDSLGRSVPQRLEDCGVSIYAWRGENAAVNYPTAPELLAGWQSSVSHNALLLDPVYRAAGISWETDSRTGAIYWVLDVSSNVDPPVTVQMPTGTPSATRTATPTATIVPTLTPVPFVPLRGQNRLQNGDFEQGTAGWTRPLWQTSLSGPVTQPVHSGTWAYQFRGRGSGVTLEQTVPVTGGETLEVSGWLRVDQRGPGLSGTVELLTFASGGQSTGVFVVGNLPTEPGWQLVQRTVTLPANAARATLRVRFPTLDGTVVLDDWVVE